MDSQLYAAPVHENTGFCGQTVSKSTSVHEIVGSGGQDIKQPGFYVEPFTGFPVRPSKAKGIAKAMPYERGYSLKVVSDDI
jgi:hypothetical protein